VGRWRKEAPGAEGPLGAEGPPGAEGPGDRRANGAKGCGVQVDWGGVRPGDQSLLVLRPRIPEMEDRIECGDGVELEPVYCWWDCPVVQLLWAGEGRDCGEQCESSEG
jgi:hypothetical protein